MLRQLVECETTSNWLWMRYVCVKPWQLKIYFQQHALWYNGVVDSLLHTDISAFNSELGTITVYGYLMIGLPATVFTIGAAVYAYKGMTKHTGLTFEQLMRDDLQ